MLEEQLRMEIERYTTECPDNRYPGTDIPMWQTPLVGFSRGDDPGYEFLRDHIGDFYLPPERIFALHYPGAPAGAGELSVVSYVLPQSRQARESQRQQDLYPSRYWALSRTVGEDFNRQLMGHIEEYLRSLGIPAVAPSLSEHFQWVGCDRHVYASTWSERHTAYLSGLGTFGLCDGLITPAGKSMRCGSVVFRAAVTPTPRPYTRYNEYCTHDAGCRACMDRCPAGAITESGHDKVRCREYQSAHTLIHNREAYHVDTAACGLCQCGVPCESGIPRRD